jgi:hypothetical protein
VTRASKIQDVKDNASVKRPITAAFTGRALRIEQAARLFNHVEPRTIYRWVDCGMPRLEDGRIPMPEAALWWQLYQHRLDHRCDRPLDADLLTLLNGAQALWPEQVKSLADAQRFLLRTAGFALTPSTIETIRED